MDGTRRPLPAWLAPAAILAVALLAYLPALGNGWIWDDPQYVTGNRVLTDPGGLFDLWFRPTSIPQYYPVVHSTFWLEVRLWGMRPFGFHLVNVLLHGANAALLFVLLRRLAVPGAWFAGMLFALHPVHVESVAWVTERKNVLSGLFYLLALLQWLRFSGLAGEGKGSRRAWALSLACFVLALLSKSVTATLPALALVLAWWKRGRIAREDVLPLLPFFAIGIASGLATAALERGHVGAEGADWALSPADRVVLAGRALWFYATSLALPVDLAFIYPRWEVDAGQAWQWLFPLGALATFALLRRRRGPLAATFAFAGTLFPALGFLNVYPFRYSFVADHFQYLASAALLALLGVGIGRVRERLGPPATAGAVLLLAALGAMTARQCRDYADEETLWKATLARNPGAWIAWNNLGVIAIERGDSGEAERRFRRALDLAPRNYEAWNNLAGRRLARGDAEGAIADARRSLAIMPEFLLAHMTLAEAFDARGDVEAALASYREAIRIKPDFFLARWNLVQTLDRQGRGDEALAACREAAAAMPRETKIRVKLGMLLLLRGAVAEARPLLEAAAREEPKLPAARLGLGEALFRSGDLEGAIAELRAAQALAPNSAKARGMLARALLARATSTAMAGDLDGALLLAGEAAALPGMDSDAPLLEEIRRREGEFRAAKAGGR